jgi:type II secretory pathway pseudopilin PulG
MLGVAHIVGLGLAGSLVALVFWMTRRSFGAIDRAQAAEARAAQAERQLDARGVAVADRDRAIASLESTNRGLRAALDAARSATPLPSKTATAEESARAIRDALIDLDGNRVPVPAAGETAAARPEDR